MDDKKVPQEVSPWVAYKLGEIHNGIKTTNGKVDTVIVEVKKINSCLKDEIQRSSIADSVHDGRLDGLETKPIIPIPNTITFKWVLEKLAIPIIMFVIGGAIALLF